MADVKYRTITEDEWDEIPVQKSSAAKPSPYDEMLQEIVDGKTIALPVDDEKDLRGIRIGIARRASNAFNAKLQFKYDAAKKVLAIRLAGEKTASSEPRKPGRPKKA